MTQRASTAVCRLEELPDGGRRLVQVDRREIAIMNVGGLYYAVRNRCPHQGGPLGQGQVGGTLFSSGPGDLRYGLEDRVLTCPWHHWEFDLANGCAIFDPKMRVKTYPVFVEDGEIRVSLGKVERSDGANEVNEVKE